MENRGKSKTEDLFKREQAIYDEAVSYMEALQNGVPCQAEQYGLLVKEYGRLLKQIRRFMKISDRTTVDLNASKLDLLDKVHYDALTGIFNRRFLEENMHKMIDDILGAGGEWLSMLMIDIDFFKRFNDTYGHQAGDRCLQAVAGALKTASSGVEGFAARYGGEEFIVVLPGCDEDEAREMSRRILKCVRELKIPHEQNQPSGIVTVSVGAATGNAKEFKAPQKYIERADQALYTSKSMGRDRSTFMSMDESAGREIFRRLDAAARE